MHKILTGLALGGALVIGLAPDADAQMRTSQPRTSTIYGTTAADAIGNNTFGIGYKLGNDIGFLGADLILNPHPNVSLDLQVGMDQGGTEQSTVAFAPAIQFHMTPMGPIGAPYVGVGYKYRLGTSEIQAAQGVFGNVGWQFRPMPSVGILVGVGYQQRLEPANEGIFNYEAGIRYFFM